MLSRSVARRPCLPGRGAALTARRQRLPPATAEGLRSASAASRPAAWHVRPACFGSRWSRPLSAAAAAAEQAGALPPMTAQYLSEWDSVSVKAALQQAAREGAMDSLLLRRLRGAASAEGRPSEEGAEETEDVQEDALECIDEGPSQAEPCAPQELLRLAELCAALRLRDLPSLSALATRLAPAAAEVPTEALLSLGSAYSTLGALNAPLFNAIATQLLDAWPAEGSSVKPAQLVQVCRAFAAQRTRHEELFDRLRALLVAGGGASSTTPAEALSLLHSHAYLRLASELGEELWSDLERKALEAKDAPDGLAELCYVIFLARQDGARLQDVITWLGMLADCLPSPEDPAWKAEAGPVLQRRILLLRSALRYLHRDAYRELPDKVARMLRAVHRMEQPVTEPKPTVSFVLKLSGILTKLRVGHFCNVEKGPFVLDIVERDRKLVYECNHFDRFYTNSIEKVASMCLQERIVKAMGYRVIQVPHWHWTRIKHKRQRAEYLRMSRYYAVKDRRELRPRDEDIGDPAVSDLDHLGEYFFKKEAPSSSWSWFNPRYDASRRIPAARAAAGMVPH
eukprot:TRINITY_DN21672_c0_g1_i1.p1 TRINITY_DN21672_c0_g1~~TRINITY_DN21672_c0_g1_i1.p1  ORF type:complete len:569 (-),score=139.49 TRINITY_DN21672_c0_g1_i1:67-1773(-)